MECWKGASLSERLYANTEPNDTGCWLWLGSKGRGGYCQLKWRGKSGYVHRRSYVLWHGPIPDGMVVCHACDVPNCINPDHLFAGTQQQNVQDSIRKGRINLRNGAALRTHCPKGHEYSGVNLYRNPNTGHRICRSCQREHDAKRREKARVQ